ncbi:MAG TPA: 2Fe-2S iron-sulfur cluster-binding protein, partial [Candidatus Thermoplasmatota archaeon]|nr:2Fe-2S iron-sulfur cluster-binding protein [Candidatus Thermoplasmatota archaeon]
MDAPECRIPQAKRGPAVTIRVDGRAVRAYVGETVATALYANGDRVLSRSIKYHRPRGLWCGVGKCASCFMRVDGKPNVRTCVTPVKEGMRVESQNALPNAKLDLYAIVDKVYRKDFDYHQKFIRPRLLKPVYHGVIRRMAGFGELPDAPKTPDPEPTLARLTVDVAVIGAGDAGRAAAEHAAKAGATVALFEESADAPDLPGVQVYRRHQAVALYPEDGLVVMRENGLLQVRAKAHILATGTYDVLPVFEGNDLPGILSPRAADALLKQGVAPGARVVIAGATDRAVALAARLTALGLPPVAVVDDGHAHPMPPGIPRFEGARVKGAVGGTQVEAVVLMLPNGQE